MLVPREVNFSEFLDMQLDDYFGHMFDYTPEDFENRVFFSGGFHFQATDFSVYYWFSWWLLFEINKQHRLEPGNN